MKPGLVVSDAPMGRKAPGGELQGPEAKAEPPPGQAGFTIGLAVRGLWSVCRDLPAPDLESLGAGLGRGGHQQPPLRGRGGLVGASARWELHPCLSESAVAGLPARLRL